MRALRAVTAVLTLSALAASAGQAQSDLCGHALRAPAVGGWAEYQISGQTGGFNNFRLAAIGSETRDGKQLMWLEMTTTDRGQRMVAQLLVPAFPYQPDQIQGMIMKSGDQPAMKMSSQMLGMMRSQMSHNPAMSMSEACKGVTLVGEESVTVPAGSFRAQHFHDAADSTDVWVAENVPFGLVKVTDSARTTVLTGHGSGAKSSITETPQEMPMRR